VISLVRSLIFTSVGTAAARPLQTPLAKKNPVKFSPHFYLCFREKKITFWDVFLLSLSLTGGGKRLWLGSVSVMMMTDLVSAVRI
jgi:hypothetical protein